MRGFRTLLKRALLPVRRRGASFGRDQKGTTAIEFGILALPFFTIIFAILETSMVFLAGQVLDSAVQDAARMVRTGQASSFTLAQFRTQVCSGLYSLFDCSKLKIRVSTLASFSTVDTVIQPPIAGSPCNIATDATQCWRVVENYIPGTGSSIELVQVYYKWPTIINFGGFNLENQPDGSRLLAAVRVFRNEPF